MPKTLRSSRVFTIIGENTNYATQSDTPADNVTESNPSVAAAKSGTLTARTSDSVGTLTFGAGHGFVDTDIVDLYWATGQRVGVVLGTPTGNAFPTSGGSGDVLPALNTAITAMKRHSESRVLTGDDVQWILISSPVAGYVTFTEADGTTVIVSIALSSDDSGNNFTYSWNIEDDPTGNPLAGSAVGRFLFSHGSTTAQVLRCVVGTN